MGDERALETKPVAPVLALRLATEVVEALQAGMRDRGFADVRPTHGFAFVRISAGDATVMDVARHLGITKQSASQLVDQLETAGYVSRHTDRSDGRVWRLRLTRRGRDCTAAADAVLADIAARWRVAVGDDAVDQLDACMAALTTPGPLRPAW